MSTNNFVNRKTIQFFIGVILAFLGVPSESSLINLVSKKILCDKLINQCKTADTISFIIFIAGILAVLEVVLEWFEIIKFD